jgi:hypothetical protein
MSSFPNLQEVYLDHSSLLSGEVLVMEFLEMVRESLTKVSCLGLRRGPRSTRGHPLVQGELMEFVRNAPKLRYFRSHLNPHNTAILRQERPEVKFASSVTTLYTKADEGMLYDERNLAYEIMTMLRSLGPDHEEVIQRMRSASELRSAIRRMQEKSKTAKES